MHTDATTEHGYDQKTADAFATSWNNLPQGSVYTIEQFEDWFAPLTKNDVAGRTVLELGCGNGSLLTHMASWNPSRLVGVDLGDSVLSARQNLGNRAEIIKSDLVTFQSDGFDLVYSIGVLHHLYNPDAGFKSVLQNTKPGGKFHVWVYAKEGNTIIRYTVDPLRRVVSQLPWWLVKYMVATPLAFLYFLYVRLLFTRNGEQRVPLLHIIAQRLPLYAYSEWISRRDFLFFRHIAFDQLVTPQTTYIPEAQVRSWLAHPDIDQDSTYNIFRNANSWKCGGTKKKHSNV
jgi:SAM-dependent methyltransferase